MIESLFCSVREHSFSVGLKLALREEVQIQGVWGNYRRLQHVLHAQILVMACQVGTSLFNNKVFLHNKDILLFCFIPS